MHKHTHTQRHTEDAYNETADLLVLCHSDAGLTSHLALLGVETKCKALHFSAEFTNQPRCYQISQKYRLKQAFSRIMLVTKPHKHPTHWAVYVGLC